MGIHGSGSGFAVAVIGSRPRVVTAAAVMSSVVMGIGSRSKVAKERRGDQGLAASRAARQPNT